MITCLLISLCPLYAVAQMHPVLGSENAGPEAGAPEYILFLVYSWCTGTDEPCYIIVPKTARQISRWIAGQQPNFALLKHKHFRKNGDRQVSRAGIIRPHLARNRRPPAGFRSRALAWRRFVRTMLNYRSVLCDLFISAQGLAIWLATEWPSVIQDSRILTFCQRSFQHRSSLRRRDSREHLRQS